MTNAQDWALKNAFHNDNISAHSSAVVNEKLKRANILIPSISHQLFRLGTFGLLHLTQYEKRLVLTRLFGTGTIPSEMDKPKRRLR